MTDCTVAAPVRATKAPPNGKATPRPLSPATTSATTRPAVSEASRAASEALTYVSFLMCEIVENDDLTKEFEVSANLFRVADEQAAVLAYGDDDDQPVEVRRPEIESLAAAINAAVESLDAAAQDSKLGAPMVVVTLAQHAQELLGRITDALEVSHVTLSPLKELNTYAGSRPLRDRPTPPIRRTPTATYTIARNDQGEIHFDDREDLERFVVQGVSMLASLNVCLSSLVNSIGEGGGPDYGFIADFSTHVSNLTYEHQSALECLFGKAGAA